MPVWLTFFIALVATVGFFGSIYFVVVAAVEARRAVAKPKFGLAPGDAKGQFKVWVSWDTTQFALSVYRIKVSYVCPDQPLKEGNFSVTYESPQKAPFTAAIEVPESVAKYLEGLPARKCLVTYEIKFVENIVLAKTIWVEAFTKVINGQAISKKVPKLENTLAVAKADPPAIFSLEYQEMVLRLKKVREMEAAAKAKAAKAAAAKAAPVAAPAATTPA